MPTLRPQAKVAIDLLELKSGQVFYDLGCGDGKLLILAAEKGVRAIGIEINLLLVIISWLRTRRYSGLVTVKWANFWTVNIDEADAVFVFLHTRFMQRLHNKIIIECKKPINLVSYAFRIPGKTVAAEKQGLILYRYQPLATMPKLK